MHNCMQDDRTFDKDTRTSTMSTSRGASRLTPRKCERLEMLLGDSTLTGADGASRSDTHRHCMLGIG